MSFLFFSAGHRCWVRSATDVGWEPRRSRHDWKWFAIDVLLGGWADLSPCRPYGVVWVDILHYFFRKHHLITVNPTVFQDHPPTPPSAAQEASKSNPDGEPSFFQSLKNLLLNVNYILLLLSYGINVGVFYAISTLLNPVSISLFTNLTTLILFFFSVCRWFLPIILVMRWIVVESDCVLS